MTWKSIFASVPFGILAVRAGNLFNLICSHTPPPTFTHGGALLAGQGIAAVSVSARFYFHLGLQFPWNVIELIYLMDRLPTDIYTVPIVICILGFLLKTQSRDRLCEGVVHGTEPVWTLSCLYCCARLS
jgi:hypothetical protein